MLAILDKWSTLSKGTTGNIKTTIKAVTEAFEADYNKGANFFYMGKPDEKGKGRRINISYINLKKHN